MVVLAIVPICACGDESRPFAAPGDRQHRRRSARHARRRQAVRRLADPARSIWPAVASRSTPSTASSSSCFRRSLSALDEFGAFSTSSPRCRSFRAKASRSSRRAAETTSGWKSGAAGFRTTIACPTICSARRRRRRLHRSRHPRRAIDDSVPDFEPRLRPRRSPSEVAAERRATAM